MNFYLKKITEENEVLSKLAERAVKEKDELRTKVKLSDKILSKIVYLYCFLFCEFFIYKLINKKLNSSQLLRNSLMTR